MIGWPLLAFALIGADSIPRPLDRADLEPWLDGYLTRGMAEAGLAGAVVVVVKDGRILLAKGYGVADVATRRPVDPDRTLFRVGSISKLITATLVMQLVEQNRLDLDRDINGYLDFEIPPFNGRPLTLRNLLSHQTGFEDALKQLVVVDPAEAESLREYLIRHQPRRIRAPGGITAYSNYGFALAGYIVERTVAMPFADAAHNNVFAPLGMDRSTFAQPLPASLLTDMASGYRDPAEAPKPFAIYGPAPAGSLSATGADMGRFMIAHLQGGQFEDHRILADSTARAMRERSGAAPPGLNGIGLGFWQYDRNGHRIVGHDGGDPVFRSNLRLLPDDGVGIFISFNALGANGGVFPIRALLIEQFLDRYFPGAPPAEPAAPTTVAHARLAAGVYQPSDHKASFFGVLGVLDQVEIEVADSGMIVVSSLRDGAGRPKRWIEVGDWVWREVGGQDRLAMTVDHGRVTMVARSSDPTNQLLRVPSWHRWAVPAFIASLIVLAATALGWLFQLRARTAKGRLHHLSRFVALVDVLFVLGWASLFVRLGAGEAELFSNRLDPVLRALQLLGLASAVGTLAVVTNAVVVWRGRRGWPTTVREVSLAAAAIIYTWFGLVTGLLEQSLRY